MIISSSRARKRVRIEIIPLIDIIFFLLATFVMVSLSMVRNKGVAVTLPAASTSTPQPLPEFTTLSITKEGAMFLDKEPVAPADLPSKLTTLKATAHGDPRVLINGDEAALLGHAIRVLDECRRVGIDKVTFQTRPRDP
jgi:biopolymer transport protein ExbD